MYAEQFQIKGGSTTNVADVKQLGTAIVTTDNGLVTNTIMHGKTTGGGGGYVDVKVTPAGALTVEATVSNFPATQPVSGTVAVSNFPLVQTVSGPLTDAQLRATPVPVSGTITTGGLTDTQLRATPVPVSLTSTTITNFPATQAISAASLPLPTGASTSALQTTGNTSLASIDTKVTGLATSANQTTLGSQTTKINDGTNTAAVKASNTYPLFSDTALVVTQSPVRPATYSASFTNLAAVAGVTDLFTITGSASKTIKIKHMSLSGTATAAVEIPLLLIKRSTANTAGTSTTATNVPFDSTNVAATATVRGYTANPTLGTAVGTLQSEKVFVSTTTTDSDLWSWETPANAQDITLRGTTEVLAVNLNGITAAGNSFNIDVVWSEE